MAFIRPELSYDYDELEPHIDAQMLEIHHSKHHATYTDNLNRAISGTELENQTIEEILSNISKCIEKGLLYVYRNAGAFYNHNLLWDVMCYNGGGEPTGELAEAINRDFSGLAAFKEKFVTAAVKHFNTGWIWLCVQKGGKLEICSTRDHDNPLMDIVIDKIGYATFPIFTVDLWEHAYYIQYQNRRADYVNACFNVANWAKVAELYAAHK